MIDKKRLVEEFCELVAIDAPSYQEREIADVLKKKLLELGFDVQEDQAGERIGGNCGNLYGYLPGTIEGEPLLFSSHMDTVPPAKGKKALVHADGKITSQGNTVLGADDVSGIVSILEAIRSIREDNVPHRSIEVLFTVAEEVFTAGCNAFHEIKLKSKEVYVLDLSGEIGKAAYRAPSILTFQAEIIGKASHAGFAPEQGIHAIWVASQAIAKMKLGRVDENITINIGTIAGGEAINIVPPSCVIKGEVRGFYHEATQAYLKQVRDAMEREVQAHGASLQWKDHVNCVAYRVDPEGITAKRYKEACRQAGIEAKLVETFGGSDYNALALMGITGLVLTNAMNNVHSCEEYTEIEEICKSTQIVVSLMTSHL